MPLVLLASLSILLIFSGTAVHVIVTSMMIIAAIVTAIISTVR